MRSPAAAIAPIAMLAVVIALAAGAAAHALFVSSDPAPCAILPSPPTQVFVTLSERIQAGPDTWIRVTNVTGARFENGTASVLASDAYTMSVRLKVLLPGVYTVAWGAISADETHFTFGSYEITVQKPDGRLPGPLPTTCATAGSAPVSPVEVALQFLTTLGLAVGTGGAALLTFAWFPATANQDEEEDGGEVTSVGPVASRDGGDKEGVEAEGLRRGIAWALFGSVLFAASAAGWAGWTAALGSVAIGTSPFLQSLVARALLGAAAALVLVVAYRRRTHRPKSLVQVGFLIGVGAIAAGAFATHAAASAYGALGVGLDAAHLLGVAVWVGGLLAIVRLRRWIVAPEAAGWAPDVLRGFSGMAFVAVGLVLFGGLGLALILVGTLDNLFGGAYGWIVLAKSALFAPMVALGAYNRYRLLPRAEEADSPTVPGVARNVRREFVLGALVLALAALLTAISPPIQASSPFAGGFALDSIQDGVKLDFEVGPYPTVPQNYTFTVLVYNATTNTGYRNATAANLTFSRDGGTPSPPIALSGPHGNDFYVSSDVMAQPGTWQVRLVVARNNGPDLTAYFYIPLHGP